MADPPPGRLPASAFTPFNVNDRVLGSEINPDPLRSAPRGSTPVSEMVGGAELKAADCSLSEVASSDGDDDGDDSGGSCEDDASVNTEEEYRRDLEEQRLADERNGHFTEIQLPGGDRLMGSDATAAHVARVFYEAAAASSRNWGSSGGERGVSSLVGDPLLSIPDKEATLPTVTSVMQHASLAGDVVGDVLGMGKETMMGVGGYLGGSMHESTLRNVHDVDGSMAADFGLHFSKISGNAFIAPADSPTPCLTSSPHLPSPSHEENTLGGGRDEKGESLDIEMNELPAASTNPNLRPIFEGNFELDLAEGRPLVVQQLAGNHPAGPSLLDSPHGPPNQVLSHAGPILISPLSQIPQPINPAHPISAQPNLHKNAASNLQLPKFPTSLKIKPLAQAKNKSHIQSNPTLPNASAHFKNKSQPKNNKSNPNSILQNKQLADSLFFRSKHDEHAPDLSPSSLLPPAPAPDIVMADFPPLEPSVQSRTDLDAGVNPAHRTPAPITVHTPQVTPHLSSPQPNASILKNRWADLMEAEHVDKGGNFNSSSSIQDEQPASATGGQPTILFGRSVADVLRSGQPAEGPVFLDRDKAEKRGEVRIVEGKPCLFFSANETSILAGRLGPAVVGKFSHSIPPARQIQKALGNLKFVGTMTWNFLNAKHIFIQLSDMRDYVKLLNGPNNSPVWYIDHHPMRVFKWTPDFDPFFESPIFTAWCNILALPVHLFEESSLIAIGEMLGKPVQVDRATISRSRVSFARICVEIDLSRPIVEEIDINIAGKHVTLKVKWEKIPLYCHECKHVGHSALTCYASGKRPMPPKKDYSRGPPMQNRPAPNDGGGPHQPYQPHAASPAAGRQPQAPRQQFPPEQAATRPLPKVGQPSRPDNRRKEMEVREPAPTSVYYHGSSSTAATGSRAANDDGFVASKKNKKNKKKQAEAQRRRSRERRREEDLARYLGTRTMSGGERQSGADPDDSSSQNERGSRSLSPSLRLGLGFGPLAMVPHHSNMFGALNNPFSDEDAPDPDEDRFDELDDGMMVDDSVRRIHFTEPAVQYIGYTSPPPEGTPKRAKMSASPPY